MSKIGSSWVWVFLVVFQFSQSEKGLYKSFDSSEKPQEAALLSNLPKAFKSQVQECRDSLQIRGLGLVLQELVIDRLIS